jgi:hypothetical protein
LGFTDKSALFCRQISFELESEKRKAKDLSAAVFNAGRGTAGDDLLLRRAKQRRTVCSTAKEQGAGREMPEKKV